MSSAVRARMLARFSLLGLGSLIALGAVVGVAVESARAADVDSITAPDPRETYYGDWGNVRLSFAASGSTSGGITWEVVSGLPDSVTTTFSSGTTGNLDLSRVGRGPDAGTYTIVVRATGADSSTQTASATFTILPRPVEIGGSFTVLDKTYGDPPGATIDNNSLTLERQATDGLVGRGILDLDWAIISLNAQAAFDGGNEDAGTRTALLTGSTLVGSIDGRDLSGNYDLQLVGSGDYTPPTATATISPKALTLDPTSLTFSKTYDGTTSITPTGTPAVTRAGVVGDDPTPTVTGSPTWTLDSAGAGSGKTVTITSGSYTLSDPNYSLSTTSLATATVSKASLEVQFSVTGKQYDGSDTLPSGNVTIDALSGLVGADSGTRATFASARLADSTVGTHAVTLTGLTLDPASALDNYTVTQEAQTGEISKKLLTLTGSFTADNKPYDATQTATGNVGGLNVTGKIGSEDVSIDPTTVELAFSQANVGAGLTVSIVAVGLTGDDAGNYEVSLPSDIVDTADIEALVLTFPGPTVADKIYDATRDADVTCTPDNVPADETATVLVDCTNALFDSADYTGSPSTITVTPVITVDGVPIDSSSNYRLPSSPSPYTFTLTQTIQKKTLTISGLAATDRQYNGTTVIAPKQAVEGVDPSLVGIEADDSGQVTLLSGDASLTIASPNASDDPAVVTVSGYALSGDRAFNYQIQHPTDLTVTISPRLVNIAVTGVDKVYDSNRNLPAGWACTVTPVAGDPIAEDSLAGVSCGSGSYLNQEHVGTQTIRLYNVAVSNSNFLAQNIVLRTVNNVEDVPTADVTGVISKRPLTILNGTMQYTGNATGDATYATDMVAGDQVTVEASTTFIGSEVDSTSTAINVTDFTVEGSDIGNYEYSTTVGGQTAVIVEKRLTVVGFVSASREYDGTTNATVYPDDLTKIVLSGVVGEENVTLRPASGENPWPTFRFATRHAANNVSLVRTGNFALVGDDAIKYVLDQPSLRANITQKALSLTGGFTAEDKTYDATTAATVATNTLEVAGKAAASEYTLTLTTPTVVFTSANAGDRTVSISEIDFTVDASTITNGSTASQIKNSYTFTFDGVTATATIDQAQLTISGLEAVDRIYDGTTSVDPGGTPVLTGIVDGDADFVGLNSSSASLEMADASYSASAKPVTVTGYTLTAGSEGDRSANYTLSQPTGITVSISKAPLTISGADAVDRAYNGSSGVTPGGTPVLVGLVAGDANYVALNTSGATMNITNNNPNYSATAKAVTATGYALQAGSEGDRSANYTLSQPTGITVLIGKATLPVTVTAADKPYDGTNSSTLTATIAQSDLFERDRTAGLVTATASGTFAQANVSTVGDGTITVNVASVTLAGSRALNYTPSFDVTTTATIDPFELTLVPRADDKVYDGTNSVETDGNAGAVCEFTKPPAATNDNVTVDCSTAVFVAGGGFDAADVAFTGTGSNAVVQDKDVSITGISLGGADKDNYSLAGVETATARAKILRAPVTLENLIPQDKFYDGDTFATYDDDEVSLEDANGNPVVGLSFTNLQGNFTSKTPGTYFVRLSAWTLTGTGAGNYRISIDGTQRQATIWPRPLVIAVSAADKDYDRTDSVTLTGSVTGANLDGVSSAIGVIGSEVITLTASGSFDDVNAAGSVGVTVDSVTIGGADKDNYSVHSFNASTTAEIRQIALTWTLTAADKTYDGNRDAGVTLADISDDRIVGDTFTVSFASGLFDTANVGENKTVTVTGLSITGGASGNYTYATSVTDLADITARTITVTGTFSAAPKVYDRDRSATVDDTSSLTLANIVAGDVAGISIDETTASFDNRNVGEDKTVSLDSLTVTGANSANYTVDVSGVTDYTEGVITPKPLTPTITVQDRLWDGTTNATITSITLAGVIGDDTVSVDTANAVAAFRDAEQGEAKPVDVTNIRFTETGAWANYVLDLTETAPGVYSGTTTASITGRALTITITASDKTYDGTRAATVNVTFRAVDNSIVTPTYSGGAATFSQENVGSNLLVTASGFTLTGDDADEFVLTNTTATARAAITAVDLGITAADKVYDGSRTATVALDGVVSGDTVSFTSSQPTFDTKNVGSDKTVTATDLVLTGADSPNYTIDSTENALADITVKLLTPTFTPTPAVTAPANPVTVTVTDDRVAGDTLSVDYTGAEAIRRGNQLVLVVSGITLSGADAANYRVVTPAESVLITFPAPESQRPNVPRTPEATAAIEPPVITTPGTRPPGTTGTTQGPSPTPTQPTPTSPTTPAPGNTATGQTGSTPDILPGWRPPASPRATIDFGDGVVSRQLDPREIAEQIRVEAPQVIAGEQFSGFAPGANTQLEIMGARTISQITVPQNGTPTVPQLQQAFQNATQDVAPEAPRVLPAASPTGFDTPTPEELELLQDALAWLGLPEATRGPGLAPGSAIGEVVWRVEGFRPGSAVFLVATSEPSLVAWGIAGEDGAVSLRGYVLDNTLPPGDHRFRVVGTSVIDDIPADETGATTIGRDLNEYLAIFDDDTRVSVALWGENADGSDHVAVRYIDPSLAEPGPLWWWLLLPAVLWMLVVLWRRRRGQWNEPGPTAGAVAAGALLMAPAAIVGAVVADQELLVPWSVGVGVAVALAIALLRSRQSQTFARHPGVSRESKRPQTA